MRKGTTIVALVALLVAIFATAAYAATIYCDGGGCFGTSDPDTLWEDNADNVNDQMYGYGGEDELYAYQYENDVDKLYGGRGNDLVVTLDGDTDDVANGGRGQHDRCFVDPGDEVHKCDGNVFHEAA